MFPLKVIGQETYGFILLVHAIQKGEEVAQSH